MNYVVHCKKSKFDIYIGRPSIWGNPFSHKSDTLAEFKVSTREEAISKFTKYLLNNQELLDKVKELKGKVLGCWCFPDSCHGEILAEIANNEKPRLFLVDKLPEGY